MRRFIGKRRSFISIVLIAALIISTGNAAQVKSKYQKGIYYQAKKKVYIQLGSQWDRGNECTIYTPRIGDPSHLDEYGFRYKKGKLVSDFAVITIKKKKLVWKNKKKPDWVLKKLSGTYKYKGKGAL